jgi:hypothetical protein
MTTSVLCSSSSDLLISREIRLALLLRQTSANSTVAPAGPSWAHLKQVIRTPIFG